LKVSKQGMMKARDDKVNEEEHSSIKEQSMRKLFSQKLKWGRTERNQAAYLEVKRGEL
jgi:hypothetical protein